MRFPREFQVLAQYLRVLAACGGAACGECSIVGAGLQEPQPIFHLSGYCPSRKDRSRFGLASERPSPTVNHRFERGKKSVKYSHALSSRSARRCPQRLESACEVSGKLFPIMIADQVAIVKKEVHVV